MSESEKYYTFMQDSQIDNKCTIAIFRVVLTSNPSRGPVDVSCDQDRPRPTSGWELGVGRGD